MEKEATGALLRQVSEALAATVEAVSSAVVRVEGRRRGNASGVAWSADGLVMTAHHAVQRDHNLRIGLPDGDVVAAELVGRDPTTDLALLRAHGAALQPPDWTAPDALRVGHLVLSVGRHDAHAQAGLGIVAARNGAWRTPAGGNVDAYVQTDIAIYPGFSGSALVDAEGRVLGVNTSGLARGTGLTLPLATLQRVAGVLLEHGRVRRGYVGIGTQPVRLPAALARDLDQTSALLVFTVEPDSPADRAGLYVSDLLVGLDDQPVRTLEDLLALLSGDLVGRTVTARVLRGEAVKALPLTIGERD